METKQDASCGVVPLFKTKEGGWEVLVIHQFSNLRGDSYWVFPKGHPERGETGTETALRELAEETGITDVSIDPTKTFLQKYQFVHEQVRIDKTVTYFIGYVADKTLTLHPTELRGALWLPLDKARERLTHDVTKEMFDQVVAYVESGGGV